MAWTAPRTWVVGEVLTAALLNTHVRDNLLETGTAKVTTAEDIVVATGANALKRLAKGVDAQFLSVVGGAVAWATAVNPGFAKVTHTALGGAANGITFSSLDSAVDMWRITGRVFQVSTQQLYLVVNADGGANYWWASHRQKASTVTSTNTNGDTLFPLTSGSIDNSGNGGVKVEVLVSKPVTGKWAAIDVTTVYEDAADSGIVIYRAGGFWRNTANAVSSLEVRFGGSNLMAADSHLMLEKLNI